MRPGELLFPRRCVFCGELLLPEERSAVCPECEKILPRTKGGEICQRGALYGVCYSPLWYTGNARKGVLRLKFGHKRGCAPEFARRMTRALPPDAHFDAVSWVPVSFIRRHTRGYDQARLLAKAIAKEKNLPLVRTLYKIRHNPAQSGLGSASARRANVTGVYRAVRKLPAGSLLLVDDVITSGATLGEAARVLRTRGVEEITCVTLTRSRGEKSTPAARE